MKNLGRLTNIAKKMYKIFHNLNFIVQNIQYYSKLLLQVCVSMHILEIFSIFIICFPQKQAESRPKKLSVINDGDGGGGGRGNF